VSSRINEAVATGAVDLVGAMCDGGSFRLYTGTVPAYASVAPGTAIVTCPLEATAFGPGHINAGDAEAHLEGVPEDSSVVGSASVATYYRLHSAAGATVIQGTAGAAGSGADFILNSALIPAGVAFTLDSYTLHIPLNEA
jgi:hypothetical protein